MKFLWAIHTFLLLVQTATAGSSVLFEKTSMHMEVSPVDKVVRGEFPFKVISGNQLIVIQCEPSCSSCTTLTLTPKNKEFWSKGDKGILQFAIDLEHLSGESRNTLSFKLLGDDVSQLEVVVKIPPAFTLEPKTLIWQDNEAPSPKTLTIIPNEQVKVKAIAAKCDKPEFKCKLLPQQNQREFRLQVIPSSIETGTYATLKITTDSDDKRFSEIIAYAVVAPSPQK